MSALDILADALRRCRDEDLRIPAVLTAIDALARSARVQWPFDQFTHALGMERPEDRYQNANAALNAIRLNLRTTSR